MYVEEHCKTTVSDHTPKPILNSFGFTPFLITKGNVSDFQRC